MSLRMLNYSLVSVGVVGGSLVFADVLLVLLFLDATPRHKSGARLEPA